MAKVSLTNFVDFVTKAGTPRVTAVKHAKTLMSEPYDPAKDYWKGLREGIVNMHKMGSNKKTLNQTLNACSSTKAQNYAACVHEYQKWMGRKTFGFREIKPKVWSSGGLSVRVNPELDLTINGTSHVVKLYFKADALPKIRIETVLALLGLAFPGKGLPALFDVRRRKLHVPRRKPSSIQALLKAEAVAYVTLWNQV